MSNKGRIIRECDRLNTARRAMEGRVSEIEFFHAIRGDLLVTGNEAGNQQMREELVGTYINRNDMPNIVLTSRMRLIYALQKKRDRGELNRVMISCPSERNYMPFYGMSVQQFSRFVRMTADEMGYGNLIDRVMIYTAAVLDVVAARYPVSLPALTKLLEEDDDYIADYAMQSGLSNVVADNIRGNHEAGIALRRLCERLEEIFEEVYEPGCDTKYNFQSGAKGKLAGMVMYACSLNQSITNSYLKEEIYHTLRRVSKLRIILDEMLFEENDELLRYLLQAKRQGKIELIFISGNARDHLHESSDFDFSNIIMFRHSTPSATDDISKELFGTYQYHFPAPAAGDTPHILVSVMQTVHWGIQSEERPRVRYQDLNARNSVFGHQSDYLAVKTTANDNVYLIHTSDFLSK